MQDYRIADVPMNTNLIPVPSNCIGVSTVGFDKIFWFPNDDMTELNIADINAAVLAHKYGRVIIGESGELDTYIVSIITTQASVTPVVNGITTELINVVDNIATFEVLATETFTIGTLLLDMDEVTYVIN